MLKRQLAQGHNIGLYPEGGCKGRRLSLPFKHGAFELSFQSKVPIVPVFLHYEAQQDFEWYQQSLIQKIWQITQSQNRTANYYIYDPIFPENFSDPQALGAHIEKLYQQWQTQHLI
jgi:1-acyl-sn-glycerol-3-phosphate acyltransferase